MPLFTTLAALSQTPASNPPDGSVDLPSTIDDQMRLLASFIAILRDGKGFTAPVQLASGTTTDIGGQNALFVEITGTTTITGLGTNYNGPRFLRFTGALTLTHNATALNLPGAADIVTAAGDTGVAIPNQASSGWNVVQFQRALVVPEKIQTVQDVTASRSLSTVFTNSTGRPIFVHVQVATTNASPVAVSLTVAGVAFSGTNVVTSGLGAHVSAIVPAGATYSAAVIGGGTATLSQWRELR